VPEVQSSAEILQQMEALEDIGPGRKMHFLTPKTVLIKAMSGL